MSIYKEKADYKNDLSKAVLDNAVCETAAHTCAAGAEAGMAKRPYTNRGGKSLLEDLNTPLEESYLIKKGKKGIFVRIPKPDTSVDDYLAIVDYVSFTFPIKNFTYSGFSDNDVIVSLSNRLFSIFNLHVTTKRQSGMNFYDDSYDIGEPGWGFVAIGGQNDTCQVTLKGQGLLNCREGWAFRLIPFLDEVEAKITRVDLASDLFNSPFKPHDFLASYKDGLFKTKGRSPSCSQLGDWVNDDNKGRTFTVGKRGSGKYLRIYEKGLQLGGYFSKHFSDWVRIELELGGKDRVVPTHALIKPAQYLAGAYPALSFLYEEQSLIKTKKNMAQISVDRALETVRHQFGKYIYVFSELFGNDKAIELLTRGKTDIPKNLDFGNYQTVKAKPILADASIKLEDIRL